MGDTATHAEWRRGGASAVAAVQRLGSRVHSALDDTDRAWRVLLTTSQGDILLKRRGFILVTRLMRW